jgi:hypothetical protein
MWRTGTAAYEPRVKEFLGLHPEQHLIAFVYIGYPETKRPPPIDRPSFQDRTIWMQ